MKLKLLHILPALGASLFFVFFSSCNSKKLDEPTISQECFDSEVSYNNNIKPIVDTYCATAGCHDGNGVTPGNYTTYATMLPSLENGLIASRVVDLRGLTDNSSKMPPPYAPAGFTDLPDDLYEMFECWLQKDYPE